MDENNCQVPKISGYLEKKGKKKILASYKKYWFVLEGRLLLYYRSKMEYEAISPCKGSINIGPSCNVKPCPSSPGVFQIENRSSTITLRAENREEQNKWMQNLMAAIGSNNKNPPKLSHFRYSLDDLPKAHKQTIESEQFNLMEMQEDAQHCQKSNQGIIQRLQKMGAQSYGYPLNTLKRGESITTKSGSEEYLNEHNCLEDKTQYAVLDHRFLTKTQASTSAEHIYERIYPIKDSGTVLCKYKLNEDHLSSDGGCNTIICGSEECNPTRDCNENITPKRNSCQTDEFDDSKHELHYVDVECPKNNIKVSKKKRKKSKLTKTEADYEEKPQVKVKKCTSFIRRVWDRKTKKTEKSASDDTNASEIENKEVSLPPENNNFKTEKMLSELQNILDNKIPNSKLQIFDDENSTKPKSSVNDNEKIFEDHQSTADINKPYQNGTKEIKDTSDMKTKSDKSLDEILAELDRENEGRKVRSLIKKFSEQDYNSNENDVVLRNTRKYYYPRDEIDSDELTRLLNELANVTNAPILTPGTTSSLIGTNGKDVELSKLLPPKQRRHSEPDYDIPRPHKSIVCQPQKEDIENRIGSTRFFGPVLTSNFMRTIEDESSPEHSPEGISMTPDSLETDAETARNYGRTKNVVESQPNFKDKKRFNCLEKSYKCLGRNNYVNDFMIENELYAQPKSILKYNSLIDSLVTKTGIDDDRDDDDVFIDSLEVCST